MCTTSPMTDDVSHDDQAYQYLVLLRWREYPSSSLCISMIVVVVLTLPHRQKSSPCGIMYQVQVYVKPTPPLWL